MKHLTCKSLRYGHATTVHAVIIFLLNLFNNTISIKNEHNI